MRISKDEIRRIAGDDVVFYRGGRYFREGAVSNVTWSKATGKYRAIVQGKNAYTVIIQLEDTFSSNCNCPDYVKRKSPCKHVIATLLFIEDYMERHEEKHKNTTDKQVSDILDYFNKQQFHEVFGDIYEIRPTITIPSLIKGNNGKAFVSLQVGGKRLYKVQNLKKFLTDYYNKENIILGKEFKYIQGESRFSRKALKILDYFMEVFEIQEALGRVYYSNIFMKSDMVFTRNMLIKLLQCMEGQEFDLVIQDHLYESVQFVNQNPPIKFHITGRDDEITLDYEEKYAIASLCDDGSLVLCNGILYHPRKEFLKNFLPFYNTLGKDKEPLKFEKEEKARFLDLVLPRLHETMEINIPDSMKDHYIDEDLKPSFYLDRHKNYIKGTLYFEYGAHKLNPLKMAAPEGVIIIRKKEKEQKVLEQLESYGFLSSKDGFMIKDEGEVYQFLTEGVGELSKELEMYYSDSFKSISISNAGSLSSQVRLQNQSDLLELELDFEKVPNDELKELFHSLQLKKKYYRLKDGSFINLENEDAQIGLKILEAFQLNYKDQKNEHFLIPKYSAVYLEEYFDELKQISFQRDKNFQELVEAILQDKKRSMPVPQDIQAELRNYQKKGYDWLKKLAEHNLGGILADDMGLGKTLQSIVYMVSENGNGPHLIVCPTSLVYNWQDECNNFAPQLKTVVINGTPENRQELIKTSQQHDVIITSYPLIRRDYEFYKDLNLHTMFIDEAQYIKNPASQSAKSVKKIVARHKFALTGTPIENSLTELWSIFDFVLPGFLLSYGKFTEKYEKPIIRDEDKAVLEELIKRIQPFILRRMKKDVLKELPEKIETKLLTEMTEKQKLIYLSFLNQARAELEESTKGEGFERSSMQILSALTRLRQICCHPATFVENYTGESGKLELLMEQLPGILENGHRVLIFSQFTSMLQIIGKRLESEGIEYFYLDGGTKSEERMHLIERFNQGEKEIFLISLKAGGTGINLTGADTVVHYDPWWNPAVEEQATDRVYRIGQKNTVHVIKLLTKGTIEEKIYKLQKKKKELSDSVIEAKEVFINRLTREEIEALFTTDFED